MTDTVDAVKRPPCDDEEEDVVHRSKMLVLGMGGAGKTSLITALQTMTTPAGGVAQKAPPLLAPSPCAAVHISRLSSFQSSSSSSSRVYDHVACYDMASSVKEPMTLFFSKRTLYFICVDMGQLADDERKAKSEMAKISHVTIMKIANQQAQDGRLLYKQVFQWLRLILMHQPAAAIVLMGTKCDLVGCPYEMNKLQKKLKFHLDDWKGRFLSEKQAKSASAETMAALQKSLDALKFWAATISGGGGLWMPTVSVTSEDGVSKARQTMEKVMKAHPDVGVSIPTRYAKALDAVKAAWLRRSSTSHNEEGQDGRTGSSSRRAEQAMIQYGELCEELEKQLSVAKPHQPQLSHSEYHALLCDFQDAGDLLWYPRETQSGLQAFVILDPRLVVDAVTELVTGHDNEGDDDGGGGTSALLYETGVISHAKLVTLPTWHALKCYGGGLFVYAFKLLLHKCGAVYPVEGDAEGATMDWYSDLIVPAYWKAAPTGSSMHSTITGTTTNPKTNASRLRRSVPKPPFTKHSLLLQHAGIPSASIVRWQINLPVEMGEVVFDQFVALNHALFSNTMTRISIISSCVDVSVVGEFGARIFFETGTKQECDLDVIQIEVISASDTIGWRKMCFFVTALQKVFTKGAFTKDQWARVRRYSLYRGVDDRKQREEVHGIWEIVSTLEDATLWLHQTVSQARVENPWLPFHVDWLSWSMSQDPMRWQQIEQSQQREVAEELTQRARSIDQLALLSTNNLPKRLLPALWTWQYGPYRNPTMLRIRLLSDVSGWCYHIPIVVRLSPTFLEKHGGWIKSGVSVFANVEPGCLSEWIIDEVLAQARTELVPAGEGTNVHNFIGRLSPTLTHRDSAGCSTSLLRDLLDLHDATTATAATKMSTLSNLVCSVSMTTTAANLWASPSEVAAMKKNKKKKENLALLGQGHQKADNPAVERSGSSSNATRSPSPRLSSLRLVVNSAEALGERDWRGAHCTWEFLQYSVAPRIESTTHGDDKCSTVIPLCIAVPAVAFQLTVEIKRPSRWFAGKTRQIGQGQVDLTKHIAMLRSATSPIRIDIPLRITRGFVLFQLPPPRSVVCFLSAV